MAAAAPPWSGTALGDTRRVEGIRTAASGMVEAMAGHVAHAFQHRRSDGAQQQCAVAAAATAAMEADMRRALAEVSVYARAQATAGGGRGGRGGEVVASGLTGLRADRALPAPPS